MADQDYNRGAVGGTNWWDSSAAAARTAAGSDSGSATSTSCSSVVYPQDHSLQVMGLGLSSQPIDQWNHPLLRSDKAGAEMGGGGGFRSMLQEGMAPFGSAGQTQKLFIGSADEAAAEPEFKPIKGFSLDQQFSLNPLVDSSASSVYGNFQGLIGASDHHTPPPHQQGGGYGYHQQQPNYENLMGSGDGWTTSSNNKIDHHHQFLKPNSMVVDNNNKPMQSSQFSGGSFWNMAAAAAAAMADVPRSAATFFPVASPLIQQHQMNIPCFDEKPQHNVTEVRDTSGPGRKTSGSSSDQTTTSAAATATTSTGGTAPKRSRNEASSTLPPFKVRKEKMGDRITALQQLVSPFGKTDTASVLSEAIEYIKFLHEQVNVLSTPYLKSGASLQHQQSSDKSKDTEGPRQDLRSRGLCLVPVSSTFPVAHETTVDFWTPTFGGTFR